MDTDGVGLTAAGRFIVGVGRGCHGVGGDCGGNNVAC